jgi:hypothetical protein
MKKSGNYEEQIYVKRQGNLGINYITHVYRQMLPDVFREWQKL